MAYQPGLFLPFEVIDKINAVIDPLEKLFQSIANSPAVGEASQLNAQKNLLKFADFRREQQEILAPYKNRNKFSSR